MDVVLVRIDNRLIHGQVSTAWVQQHKIDHLIVANDAAATNPMEKSVLKMAKPRTVRALDVMTVADAAKLIKNDQTRDRTMIVTRVPQDVKGLIEAGIEVKEIYVGNMHGAPGKKQLDQCVFADEQELATLKGFSAAGIPLVSQMTPTSARTEINKKL